MELIIDYDMKDSSIEIVRLTLWRSAIMPDWASRWLLMLRPPEALQPPTEVFSQGDDHDHAGESALEILGEVFWACHQTPLPAFDNRQISYKWPISICPLR